MFVVFLISTSYCKIVMCISGTLLNVSIIAPLLDLISFGFF